MCRRILLIYWWQSIIVPLEFTPVQHGLIPRNGSLRRHMHTWFGGTPSCSPLHAETYFMGTATGSWSRSFTSYGVEMDLRASNPLPANDLIPWYFRAATALSAGCPCVKICSTPIYIECRLHVWDSKDKLLWL